MSDIIDFKDILAGLPEDEQREIISGGKLFALALAVTHGHIAELLRESGIKLIAELPDGTLQRLPRLSPYERDQ